MLRNDIVHHPTSNQVELLKQKKTRNSVQAVIAANQTALERDQYEKFNEEEMADAKKSLVKEMEYVKQRIGHGDLPLDSYSKVWNECYAQVSDFLEVIFQLRLRIRFQVRPISSRPRRSQDQNARS